jgi:hypothetical protein
MGYASFADVREGFEQRTTSGDLIVRESRSPARAFTTGRMIEYEQDTITVMRAGQNQYEPLVSSETWRAVDEKHSHLSTCQHAAAVEQVLSSQDKIVAIEGVAGAGKTTSLAAVREAVEQEGYEVRGLAPTSRAANKLAESSIESGTLQRHLVREKQAELFLAGGRRIALQAVAEHSPHVLLRRCWALPGTFGLTVIAFKCPPQF